jgi:hypothetical protein
LEVLTHVLPFLEVNLAIFVLIRFLNKVHEVANDVGLNLGEALQDGSSHN